MPILKEWLFAQEAFSEVATVLVVTIANIHFSLMKTDEDIIWLVLQWEGATINLTSIIDIYR
jgi:hypothetical protein